MRRNVRAVKDAGAESMISSCPACDMMWRHVYPVWAKKFGIDYGYHIQALQRVPFGEDQKGRVCLPGQRKDADHRNLARLMPHGSRLGRL